MTVRSAHRRSSVACRAVAICILGAFAPVLGNHFLAVVPGFLQQTRQKKGFGGPTRDSLGPWPVAGLIGPLRTRSAERRRSCERQPPYRRGYDRALLDCGGCQQREQKRFSARRKRQPDGPGLNGKLNPPKVLYRAEPRTKPAGCARTWANRGPIAGQSRANRGPIAGQSRASRGPVARGLGWVRERFHAPAWYGPDPRSSERDAYQTAASAPA